MTTLITVLIAFVAFEHFYFLVLEMFLWTKPKGIKTFGLKSKEFAEETKVLAANQGLYNGFLSAGLIWSLIIKDLNVSNPLCILNNADFNIINISVKYEFIDILNCS